MDLANGASAFDIVTPVGQIMFTDISVDPNNGQASITFSSEPEKTYSIYTSTLVGDPATQWTQLVDDQLSGGETTTFADTTSPAGPTRFYYVIENP